MSYIKALLLSLLFLTTPRLLAQLPTVDITAVLLPTNVVEVRIRPDAAFNGVFSSIVFTLRWDDASALSLGNILQDIPQLQYCTISRSGSEGVSGPYRYQIFVGFGTIPLSSLTTAWQADQEVVLCRIPVSSDQGFISLVEDAWTAANNGDYYVSLNGEDRTGVIYTLSTGAAEQVQPLSKVLLSPNPTGGMLGVTLVQAEAGPARFELLDATGRLVFSEDGMVGSDSSHWLDLGGLIDGVYLLSIHTASGVTTERVVVER